MKYNEPLVQLILNTEQFAKLLANASNILAIMDQSDDLAVITPQLTSSENYAVLKQVAEASAYFKQVGQSVVAKFVDYVLKKKKTDLAVEPEEISSSKKGLIAIRLMAFLRETNVELYEIFSRSNEREIVTTFDVVYGSKKLNANSSQVTYQFQFDASARKWQLQRFEPNGIDGEIIDHYSMSRGMKVLAQVAPDTLNPFVKKALQNCLQVYENIYQDERERKATKEIFKVQCEKLYSRIQSFLIDVADFDSINMINNTYWEKVKHNPTLMAELMLVDGLFELSDNFGLITMLSDHVEWGQIENLLNQTAIKNAFLNSEWYSLNQLMESAPDSGAFYFERASREQIQNLRFFPFKWATALSKEDLVKFRAQGKIQLKHPEYDHDIRDLYYKFHPSEFVSILEEMIVRGETLTRLPRNKEILNHYVTLFFKYNGQWLSLIGDKEHVFNPKADLLKLSMEVDPEKTVSIVKALAVEDSAGNKYFPAHLTAEEIASLIAISPGNACTLLDYVNILDALRNATVEFKPYGKIREFDHLATILRVLPTGYVEKLLRSGLLFPEKGMPHFHHLSGYGAGGGKNPGGCIGYVFDKVYSALSCDIFMSALAEGLGNNLKVNRLFFKDIDDINLLDLAKALSPFQNIKHLDVALSLKKENHNNIIKFFELMAKTNPNLNYHIHVYLSVNHNDQFIFLKDYLSQRTRKIVSLTIRPDDYWVKTKLLDSKKPEFKNFFDGILESVCQNNYSLRVINIDGLSKSIFSFGDSASYQFAQFPLYNTRMFAVSSSEGAYVPDENPRVVELLHRNRNLNALEFVINNIHHMQGILESLAWLSVFNLPPEMIVEIFDQLKYPHTLPAKVSHYKSVLDAVNRLKAPGQAVSANDTLGQAMAVVDSLMASLEVGFVRAYYRHKPEKQNIDRLKNFLNWDDLQNRLLDVIVDWLSAGRPDLPDSLEKLRVCNRAISEQKQFSSSLLEYRSQLSLISELDGIPTTHDSPSFKFRSLRNDLDYCQKAMVRCAKQLREEAYVSFQCEGSLDNALSWQDLSSRQFDGFELLYALEKYKPKDDIDKSGDVLKKFSSLLFTDFNSAEKKQFDNILLALKKYLKQKEKPLVQQCDKHKHAHKNALFKLISPDSILLFKDSKPRLYRILKMQRERLEASVIKCSLKAMLRRDGLFAAGYASKRESDEAIIVNYVGQFNAALAKPQ